MARVYSPALGKLISNGRVPKQTTTAHTHTQTRSDWIELIFFSLCFVFSPKRWGGTNIAAAKRESRDRLLIQSIASNKTLEIEEEKKKSKSKIIDRRGAEIVQLSAY